MADERVKKAGKTIKTAALAGLEVAKEVAGAALSAGVQAVADSVVESVTSKLGDAEQRVAGVSHEAAITARKDPPPKAPDFRISLYLVPPGSEQRDAEGPR
jgi:hypothetical protein